jgi:hypothetical protein
MTREAEHRDGAGVRTPGDTLIVTDSRTENIPAFIDGVKQGSERSMGFGHRVDKPYDPRARITKTATSEVFEVTGTNPVLFGSGARAGGSPSGSR